MFTGIVQDIGTVIEKDDDHMTVSIRADLWSEVSIGSSISVSGACLTATALVAPDLVRFDVMPETWKRTNLGGLRPGSKLNIELAMAANGRFDGHVVQGHVDGVGVVQTVVDDAGSHLLTIAPPAQLLQQIVEKGSITLDGISLTVISVSDEAFSVGIIPHTWEVTTCSYLASGSRVNIETDILAKYIQKITKFS